MKFKRRTLALLVVAIAVGIWFCREAFVGFTYVETAEHVDSAPWLPETASDISYYNSYLFKAYEFDISESEFKAWSRWELAEIKEPIKVARFVSATKVIEQPGPNANAQEVAQYQTDLDSRYATVTSGLFYKDETSGGGGTWIAYDRIQGRGYYQCQPR